MKIRSKYKLIPLLMILSMCVLTGFAVYWLVSQYKQEKLALHEKLVHEYLSSQDQVIDSLLFVRIVAPTMQDSLSYSIQITAGMDSLRHNQQSLQPPYQEPPDLSTLVR